MLFPRLDAPLGKTEKMLHVAKNYWDFTTQPIAFVAPTMQMAVDIQQRFLRFVYPALCPTYRVRCLSLCERDGFRAFMGKRNTVFFFDHTCLERGDLLEAAGRLVNAIWENHLGEVLSVADYERRYLSVTFKITDPDTVEALENATKGEVAVPNLFGNALPCPWGKESGLETFTVATKGEIKKPSTDLKPRHVVDKLRISDILTAMFARNIDDKAIPEEWINELNDLAWSERDRLGAKTED